MRLPFNYMDGVSKLYPKNDFKEELSRNISQNCLKIYGKLKTI